MSEGKEGRKEGREGREGEGRKEGREGREGEGRKEGRKGREGGKGGRERRKKKVNRIKYYWSQGIISCLIYFALLISTPIAINSTYLQSTLKAVPWLDGGVVQVNISFLVSKFVHEVQE